MATPGDARSWAGAAHGVRRQGEERGRPPETKKTGNACSAAAGGDVHPMPSLSVPSWKGCHAGRRADTRHGRQEVEGLEARPADVPRRSRKKEDGRVRNAAPMRRRSGGVRLERVGKRGLSNVVRTPTPWFRVREWSGRSGRPWTSPWMLALCLGAVVSPASRRVLASISAFRAVCTHAMHPKHHILSVAYLKRYFLFKKESGIQSDPFLSSSRRNSGVGVVQTLRMAFDALRLVGLEGGSGRTPST